MTDIRWANEKEIMDALHEVNKLHIFLHDNRLDHLRYHLGEFENSLVTELGHAVRRTNNV